MHPLHSAEKATLVVLTVTPMTVGRLKALETPVDLLGSAAGRNLRTEETCANILGYS